MDLAVVLQQERDLMADTVARLDARVMRLEEVQRKREENSR